MAYASLVSLAQTIDKILNQDRDSTFLKEKQQIKCLHGQVLFLQAFLEDFPEKARNLEARIRDAANEAETVIETFMSEQIRSSPSLKFPHIQFELSLRYDFDTLNQILKEAAEEVALIAREVMEMKNSHPQFTDTCASTSSTSSRRVATSKDAAVGIDDDLMAIKARLCGESTKLEFIPIVGMGGIGKTTLARYVYDDQLTVEHFDMRAWYSLSQDSSPREILWGILNSMKVVRPEQGDMDESQMAESLHKSLKGMRFLIVLDDIWSTEVWDDIKMVFPDDHKGSRIMLTTRLHDVATYPNSSSPIHEMRLMDGGQSWNLLKQKVFPRENCPLEFEIIGKEIARNCRGLPLAIVVIAGILSTSSKSQASWETISSKVSRVFSADIEGTVDRVLSLSYHHLPHKLRGPFLYLGLFPEDYEIRASKLITLWIAEGFIQTPNGSTSLEEGAKEHLEELVKRSLVMVTKRNTSGEIKRLAIHDLLRDMCLKNCREERFLLHVNDVSSENIRNERRISVTRSELDFLENTEGSNIRTIACFNNSESLLDFSGNFGLLRVLDVVNVTNVNRVVLQLPDQVFELFHLRYLSFSFTGDFYLPPSILNLQNLQTLVMHPSRSCPPFQIHLPLEIWKMSQLRNLLSSSFHTLPNPDFETSFALENWGTLSNVTNFVCSQEILRMIPNLKKLGISYSSRDEPVADYLLENLVYFRELEKLKLIIYPGFSLWGQLNVIFPLTLKKLCLSFWGRPWRDMGIVGSLPNLQVLKLRNFCCIGDKWETNEEEFCQLKFLLIDESFLVDWITEWSHFPSLKRLELCRCRNLSEIPEGIGEIPTLELIEVDDSNESLVESARRLKQEQQEN